VRAGVQVFAGVLAGLAALMITAFLLYARIEGVRLGAVFGEDAVRALTLATVASVLLTFRLLVWLVARGRRRTAAEAGGVAPLDRFNTAVAVAAALWGLVALIAPTSTSVAAECSGVQVRGAAAVGTTSDYGANAREGTARAFPTTKRFDPECVLGFDGYCVGEPVPDVVTYPADGYYDSRWLILPTAAPRTLLNVSWMSGERPEGAVSAIAVAEGDVAILDKTECPTGSVDPPDNAADPVILAATPETATVGSASEGAVLMGFAVYIEGGPSLGATQFRQIGVRQSLSGRFEAEWTHALTRESVRTANGRVTVLAAPCIAIGVPSPAAQASATSSFRLLPDSPPRPVQGPALTGPVRDRLAATACQEPTI